MENKTKCCPVCERNGFPDKHAMQGSIYCSDCDMEAEVAAIEQAEFAALGEDY